MDFMFLAEFDKEWLVSVAEGNFCSGQEFCCEFVLKQCIVR